MEKVLGSSIDVLHEDLKSPTHIHFWRKIFMDSRQFFALWFLGFSPCFYAYYAERKFCHKYTHALSPVWNRPHIRALYARKISPRYIWELRCVWNLWVIDWALVSWRSFVSRFVYAVIVWMRSFLLIGWCQNLVVKAWLDCINSL